MPWGKRKSYSFKESTKRSQGIQVTSYQKKEAKNCKDCPHRPKQISAAEEAKTGKLSRIL